MPDDNINISDVIEVIETDPDFNPTPNPKSKMLNGNEHVRKPQPKCVIVEQPAAKALRFRYECEGRSAGSIPGANSTPENKTFPAIQIQDCPGVRAVVVVSCVTKDPPYRAHPHKLVGREGCKKGVCTIEVPRETMKVQFSNLGIQCVKKKDIEDALKTREDIRVDPFRNGFGHRNQPTSIDLNAVRLCFQVFTQREPGEKYVELTPVVSDPIFDKKAMSDLVIIKLSDCVSPVDGGTKDIILLCEKVTKEDIQVRFYEEKDGQVVWEGFGEFQPSQVHKQTAIWFKPPKYHTKDVQEPVKVNIQLRRPSDGATSVPVPFQLLPLHAGIKRPGDKLDSDRDIKKIFKDIQERERHRKVPNVMYPPQMNIIPMDQSVKDEPREVQYLEPVSPVQQYGTQSPPAAYYNPFLQPSSNPPEVVPLPPYSDILPDKPWNIPSTSYTVSTPPFAAPGNLDQATRGLLAGNVTASYCNMDSQQITELKLISLDSGDLPATNLSDMNNLTENLSINLSLTDILRPDNNMTDSLDRLANNEYERFCK